MAPVSRSHSALRPRPWHQTLMLVMAALLSACAAQVNRFTIVPSHVCRGTPVKLDIQVVGTPTITTNPSLQQQDLALKKWTGVSSRVVQCFILLG